MSILDKIDLRTLKTFSQGERHTDGRFDRNACNSLEEKGLIDWVTSCGSGERYYKITEAGRKVLVNL